MPPESDLELYSVLGLKPGASPDAIKTQYRKMARQFHPDRNDGDEWCAEQLRKVIEAYEVLGDPARKADYDRRHASPPPRPVPPPPQAKPPDPPKPPPTQDYPRPNPAAQDVWDYAVPSQKRARPSAAYVLLSTILILVILAFALESVREYYDETRSPMSLAIFGDGDAPVGPSHAAPAPAAVAPVPAAPVVTQGAGDNSPPAQAFVMRTKAGGGAPPNLEPFRPR